MRTTLDTKAPAKDRDNSSLLSPVGYDDDAASIHSRSDQDSDSDDDELQLRARNSRELRAADRIVLMEEDELDKLVTDTRRKKERERRGSALAVPNPLSIFRRPSLSNMSAAGSSTDNLVSEKRQAKRAKRQMKRERMRERAEHGEDGELMYELEEGGLTDGSATDSISNRSDSDEVDRKRLNMMTEAHAQRGRSWRRWLFIHVLIAIGFAILVMVAWKLSITHKPVANKTNWVSNGTAIFGPTTLLISLDGFRADFLQRGLTPRLSAFIKEGVSPKYMLPSFPSVTFPNHYTLATGLYPEAHGIVGNTFWDPELKSEFYYTDKTRSLDPKWWGGEPFWVTAETQGVRTAIHMWPGSEAHILGVEPSIVDNYNGKETLNKKVQRVFDFLDMPGKESENLDPKEYRPQLIAAYVPNVDADGHTFGPNSTEIRTTIQQVDTMLDDIFKGLEQRNLTNIVNVIIVSDHGMATTDRERLIQFEDLVDPSKIEHTDGWPLFGLRPKNPDDLQPLYDDLAEKSKTNPNFDVYLRDVNMPPRYHFSKNQRIAPLWIIPKTGWAIVKKDEFVVAGAGAKDLMYHPRGLHGYDHEHPLMRAIFIARGPAFPHPANSQIDNFQNIELYNMLCDSVGIVPKPNNGTLRLPLKPIGVHKADEAVPEDPVSTHVIQRPTVPAEPSTSQAAAKETAVPEGEKEKPDEHKDKKPEEEKKEKGVMNTTLGDLWDWITDKVDDIWHKVLGEDD